MALYLVLVGDNWRSEFDETVATPVEITDDAPAPLEEFDQVRVWRATEDDRGRKAGHFEEMEQDDLLLFHDGDCPVAADALTRLPDESEIELSGRDLEQARQSRHQLYVESHRLYQLYRDLMDGRFDRDAVKTFLAKTIVTPTDTPTLFELFCIFRLIRALGALDENLHLRPIATGDSKIARFRSAEREISVYHDSTGDFDFFEAFPKPDDLATSVPDPMVRYTEAMAAYEEHVEQFLGRETRQGIYSGRPDILIEEWDLTTDERQLRQVLIGEVKYTDQESTFAQGLRELLEYMYFLRDEAEYRYTESSPLVKGLICTDGASTSETTVKDVLHPRTADLQSERAGLRLQQHLATRSTGQMRF